MSTTAPLTHAAGPGASAAAVHGLVAEFVEPHHVVVAARRAHAAGYREMDAYTPFPVAGLAEVMGFRKNRVATIVLAAGLIGGLSGFGMQTFSAVFHYPLIIGGRPFFSWPSFMPVTFELSVLFAAFGAVVGMLALNGLPRPHHPIFNAPGIERASQTSFFLCIESSDPKFDLEGTRAFLEGLNPASVQVVQK
jgi:hypothetical protein